MSLELFMNDAIIQKPHMKICSKCDTPKPATAEYFHRHKLHRDGLCGRCKECVGKYQKAHYHENGGRERCHKTRHKSPHQTAFSNLRNDIKKKARRKRKRGKRKFLLGESKTPEAEAYIEYLKTITHCPDCSKELVWLSDVQRNPDSASFDRIDSDEDYTKENVRIVCMHCNRQKSDLSIKEWVAVLKVRIEEGIIEEVDPRLTEFLCD